MCVKHSKTFVLSPFERWPFVLVDPPLINLNTRVRFLEGGGGGKRHFYIKVLNRRTRGILEKGRRDRVGRRGREKGVDLKKPQKKKIEAHQNFPCCLKNTVCQTSFN